MEVTSTQPQDVILIEAEDLRVTRSAAQVLAEGREVARVFAEEANKMKCFRQIGSSKHLEIEGWQMLAAIYGVSARIVSTNFVQFGSARGFEATAEAYHIKTGRTIGRADAMVLDDEDKWGAVSKYEYPDGVKTKVGETAKPLQQLRSMAQTRSCSKVYANLFKWIAKMAGYATTPAEEMTGNETGDDAPKTGQPKRKSEGQKSEGDSTPQDGKISEKQKSRFWAVAFKNGGKDRGIEIVKKHGFARVEDITTDKYDAIIAEIEGGTQA